MIIKQNDWEKITTYIKDQLLSHMHDNQIDRISVIGLLSDMSLDEFLKSTGEKKERIKPVSNPDSKFKQFWDAYPPTASFSYRGMVFKAARVLRSNFQVCEQLYNKTLATGNVTHDQIMKALQIQVTRMKEESYETGKNSLQYFSAIEVYIRQSKYEAFIGEEDNDKQQEEDDLNNYA